MNGLADKVVVLAGAGGIGTATACRLAEHGAKLVIGDVSLDAATAAATAVERAGAEARAIQLDIADEASVARFVERAVTEFGGVDGLFNVAANVDDANLGLDTDALEVPLDVWQHTLDVNLTGYLLTIRHALPVMLARGGGAIVNTVSAAAYIGEPIRVSYGVSKAGLTALTRHVAARWGKQGVRCNAVAPGFVLTPTSLKHAPPDLMDSVLAGLPTTRHGRPEDIAAMVAFLLSDDGEWVNGQCFGVDGGLTFR